MNWDDFRKELTNYGNSLQTEKLKIFIMVNQELGAVRIDVWPRKRDGFIYATPEFKEKAGELGFWADGGNFYAFVNGSLEELLNGVKKLKIKELIELIESHMKFQNPFDDDGETVREWTKDIEEIKNEEW